MKVNTAGPLGLPVVELNESHHPQLHLQLKRKGQEDRSQGHRHRVVLLFPHPQNPIARVRVLSAENVMALMKLERQEAPESLETPSSWVTRKIQE